MEVKMHYFQKVLFRKRTFIDLFDILLPKFNFSSFGVAQQVHTKNFTVIADAFSEMGIESFPCLVRIPCHLDTLVHSFLFPENWHGAPNKYIA